MRLPLITLLLWGFVCFVALVKGQVIVEDVDALNEEAQLKSQRANLSIVVKTTFPDSTIKTTGVFYNGRTSRVDVSITNEESQPITVHSIAGVFRDIKTLVPVQNLTSRTYNSIVQPGAEQTFPYSVEAYFPGPRVLHLTLGAEFTLGETTYATLAHNATVTIADPPSSFFDPGAWFIYLLLAASVAGAGYFVYKTWIRTVLPKKARPSNRTVRKREAPSTVGSASNYEEWIPAHHLNKEKAAPKKRKGGKKEAPASS